MLVIFESILPVFLLVVLGAVLKRCRVMSGDQWDGMERLGFFVLFPALLFSTLARADFTGLQADATGLATIGSVTLMSLAVLAAWPPLRRRGVTPSAFTTIFQTSTRWNGFIALAAAHTLFGELGLTLTALVMTLLILPINIYNIAVLIWFGGGQRNFGAFVLRILSNPMILASLAGILVNQAGLGVYPPLMSAVEMMAGASLSLGLIMVGAGLRMGDALRPSLEALIGVVLKLVVMPVFMVGAGYLLGMRGDALGVMALGASVPTAMNGYILAKQMGGDAPLYAATATLQTVASFFTIPLILAATAYLSAG